MTKTPEILPATPELLTLAVRQRPDLDRDDLENAIMACYEAGWTAGRVTVEVARLIAQGLKPRDLRNAAGPARQWRPA